MTETQTALQELAESLQSEGGLLSPHVQVPANGSGADAPFAELVAAGPRTQGQERDYGWVMEAVREGYLLHYEQPRVLVDVDPDLSLLAGDYLYALGLDRLARLEDTLAVELLGDLISLVALCRREGLENSVEPLWLATTVAVACGESPEIRSAKEALNAREPASDLALWRSAEITAQNSGIRDALLLAKKAIDFPAVNDLNLG